MRPETKQHNRWLIVLGGFIINLALGAIYSWSVFRIPLEQKFGWSTSAVTLTITITLLAYALGTFAGGKLQDSKGPRLVASLSGIILLAGMFLASRAASLAHLYISYGIITGFAVGLGYSCPIAATTKWFPDKKGLALGLTLAGFGGSALIFAPAATFLINGFGVLQAFFILGITYAVMVLAGAQLLKNPPEGYNINIIGAKSRKEFSYREMLRLKEFYLLWIIYITGASSGYAIIAHAAPIAQKIAGVNAAIAALIVSVLAVFNLSGRVMWASLSDKFGRVKIIAIMLLISAAALFILNFLQNAFLTAIGIGLIALCFGGYLAIFPAITSDFFGTKNIGTNYGIMFSAIGIGGTLGPMLTAYIKDTTGGYWAAFFIIGVLCLIGAAVSLILKEKKT